MTKACATCHWFARTEGTTGVCHGHGPTVQPVPAVDAEGRPTLDFVTVWPHVDEADRCPKWDGTAMEAK